MLLIQKSVFQIYLNYNELLFPTDLQLTKNTLPDLQMLSEIDEKGTILTSKFAFFSVRVFSPQGFAGAGA